MNIFASHKIRHAGTLLVLAGSIFPAYCQAPIDGSTLIPWVSDLEGPRGLAVGPDGSLYLAEGGTGGPMSTVGSSCLQVPAPVGPYTGGPSARISKIDAQGNRTTLATGLPSGEDALGDIAGVADVAFLNGTLYALLAGGGCSHGNPAQPNGIVEVNTSSGAWKYITNLSVFFLENPAVYTNAADFEVDGEPYGLIAFDGNLYSVEANHGQLVRTTPQGVNSLVADISFLFGHIVPTGLAEANGNLYVTNLGQFPITPEWEKVMTFSPNYSFVDPTPGFGTGPNTLSNFQLAAVRAGLSAALSLKFGPDGLLYALEMSTLAGDPTPGAGKVVRLLRNGTFQDVVINLSVPTGMTFGPNGTLYISNFGAAPTGAGTILRVTLPM